MTSEALEILVRINLALALGVALVLALRAPMRAWFGARVAYALWLVPAMAALACFIPARRIEIMVNAALPTFEAAFAPAPPHQIVAPHVTMLDAPSIAAPPIDAPALLLGLWIAGALVSLAVLALRQARFVKSLGRLVARADWGHRVFASAAPEAGPAVVGVINPIIVTPSDFEHRYAPQERDAVLAHERAHLAHGDPLVNAAVALVQSLNWFNPMVHLGARALRTDQELACDEAVLGAHAGARRHYAEAILKAHAAPLPAPLGCGWPGKNFQSMKERIAMLKRTSPTRMQRVAGASLVALATLGAGTLAWAVQTPETIVIAEPAPPAPPAQPAEPSPPAPVSALAPPAPPSAPSATHGEESDDWDSQVRQDRALIEAQMRAALDAQSQGQEMRRIHASAHARLIQEGRADAETEIDRRMIVERRVIANLSEAQRAEIENRANERRVHIEARAREHMDSEEIAALTAEITALAMELSRSALHMSQLEMRGDLSDAERNRLEADLERMEADIERQAERLEEIGERIGEQMSEFEVELEGAEVE
jgi:beta-lactamase regulating signal transducer with metallopeptidase domain